MFTHLREDIAAVKQRDPACTGAVSALMHYPGLQALWAHRIDHWLWRHHLHFCARTQSQWARFFTGVEIHPGATIGHKVFIDHGMGVVIGETTIIGDDVTLYQGVTLGGTGKDTGKRHPTLGNNVMVGSGARVLGPFKVGDNAKIAANAVVLSEVPPDCTAVGVPARIIHNIRRTDLEALQLDQVHTPDPVAVELCKLRMQIEALEKKLTEMEGKM